MADLMQQARELLNAARARLGVTPKSSLLAQEAAAWEAIAAALRAAKNGWVRAVDRELVCVEIGVANADDSEEVASAKLRELIDWHVAVATDPTLNGGLALVSADEVKDAP